MGEVGFMITNEKKELNVVFSEEFIKKLPGVDNFYNPSVVVLGKYNTSQSIKLREQVERWFCLLPDKCKADIKARLRSLNNKIHDSGFYELLFHQYFLEEGWKVEKDPVVDGLTPDFSIITDNSLKFYAEVFGLYKTKDAEEKDKNFRVILRALNNIKSQFLLSFNLKTWFQEKIFIKKFTQDVKAWIDSLPLGKGVHFEKEFNSGGIRALVGAIWVGEAERSNNICTHGGPAGSIDVPVSKIKDLMYRKLKKYKFVKKIKLPFVLVVSTDDLFFAEKAVDWSLYGLDVISFPVDNPNKEAKFHKDNSGFITPNPGLYGRPENKGLSAVILVKKNWNFGDVVYDMKVYHNPWALNPLPEDVFSKMPQFIKQSGPPGHITLGWKNEGKVVIFS